MQVLAGSIRFPLDLPSACERISPSRLRLLASPRPRSLLAFRTRYDSIVSHCVPSRVQAPQTLSLWSWPTSGETSLRALPLLAALLEPKLPAHVELPACPLLYIRISSNRAEALCDQVYMFLDWSNT